MKNSSDIKREDYGCVIEYMEALHDTELGSLDRNVPRDVFSILQVLSKYGKPSVVGADHDIIYLHCPDDVSAEDARLLIDMGCHIQDDTLCRFV